MMEANFLLFWTCFCMIFLTFLYKSILDNLKQIKKSLVLQRASFQRCSSVKFQSYITQLRRDVVRKTQLIV